jgi:hypothetical protein
VDAKENIPRKQRTFANRIRRGMKKWILGSIPFIILLFQGCIQHAAVISEENDVVFSGRRIKWNKTYFRAIESNQVGSHPFVNLAQTIMKEIRPNAEATYTVFDVLTMENNQFHVDEKVYLVVDNLPMLVNIKRNERENTRSISETTETCDSTKKEIITGYTDIQRKVTRFEYDLTQEMVNKIKTAQQIYFRYYSGPAMITVMTSEEDLNKLKLVLNSD